MHPCSVVFAAPSSLSNLRLLRHAPSATPTKKPQVRAVPSLSLFLPLVVKSRFFFSPVWFYLVLLMFPNSHSEQGILVPHHRRGTILIQTLLLSFGNFSSLHKSKDSMRFMELFMVSWSITQDLVRRLAIEPLIKPSSSSKVAEESAEDAPQRAVVMYSLFILLISNASIALQSALCLLQAKA